MTKLGALFLIPVPISEASGNNHIPEYNMEIVKRLTKFIAEDAKTARSFLKKFGYGSLDGAEINELNRHTKQNEMTGLLNNLLAGYDVGLMSEAGCPAIADPGSEIVRLAHEKGIEVIPLTGPSSIVLSIMASGFNGQNFAFIGYLPIDKSQRIKKIKELEQLAYKNSQAQFFIETPYRNEPILETLLGTLLPQTYLFVGADISSSEQRIICKTISSWRKMKPPSIHKTPVVFGIYK